ncbi:MAG: alpha/beta hydrolase [Lysobacterales bacterium]
MLSSIAKTVIVAAALTGVVATTSCSGQTMRERWQQRMAERRASGGQGMQQGPMGGRRNEPVNLPPGAQVERDIAYGPAPEQKMDVYRPANAQNAPVIFMVHGGGWRRGDKDAAGVVNNKVEHWLPKGYIVISVGYRLVPDVTPIGEAQDVAKALAMAQDKARSWGGDPSRFVLMGHSAGAHLVALVSADTSITSRNGVSPWLGTVALDSGAYNVVEIMQRQHFSFYDDAFGSDPAALGGGIPDLAADPRDRADALVCSSQRADSCSQAQAFADKAKSLGGRVSVYPIDMRHGEINAQLGAPGDLTVQVDNFLHSLNLP